MDWILVLAENPFYEFAIILFLAIALASVGQFLKQPIIVMFIVLGIIVGPALLDVVKSKESIHLLAEIGIAILLFIVGLKLDLRIIKSVGKIALLTGLGQVLFTSLVGYVIATSLGFSNIHSFYIAVALTFSSTIIIVKLLSDKKEIDSLHGQIAIGFLIVQDIVVILVMIVLSAMGRDADTNILNSIVQTVLAGVVLIVLTVIMMKWIIPKLSFFLAKSTEVLTLFAITWAILLASTGELMGFSREVGAFMAGVSLATSQFKEVISSRLVSLRDFMLLFFFVNIGFNIDLSVMGAQVTPAITFSLFVLIGNPLIVLIIMGIMGYRKRTSFLAGLTVAQISEFSLIFAGLGLTVGHINEDIVGLITFVGLITIGLSTYLILYSHQIYDAISPALKIFERKVPYRELHAKLDKQIDFDIIIFGVGRFGSSIADMLDNYSDLKYLGVDFDPEVVKEKKAKGQSIIYGELDDPEIVEQIPLKKTKCVISTVRDSEASMKLIKSLRRFGFKGKIYLTAQNEKDVEMLSPCNADEILFPQELAAASFYNAFIKDIV